MPEVGFGQSPPGLAQELSVRLRRGGRRRGHDRVITVGRDDHPGVATQTCGVAPAWTARMPRPDLLPEHGDAAIRGAQVLQGMDGDRPLPDLGFVVAGLPLTRLVGVRWGADQGA